YVGLDVADDGGERIWLADRDGTAAVAEAVANLAVLKIGRDGDHLNLGDRQHEAIRRGVRRLVPACRRLAGDDRRGRPPPGGGGGVVGVVGAVVRCLAGGGPLVKFQFVPTDRRNRHPHNAAAVQCNGAHIRWVIVLELRIIRKEDRSRRGGPNVRTHVRQRWR